MSRKCDKLEEEHKKAKEAEADIQKEAQRKVDELTDQLKKITDELENSKKKKELENNLVDQVAINNKLMISSKERELELAIKKANLAEAK